MSDGDTEVLADIDQLLKSGGTYGASSRTAAATRAGVIVTSNFASVVIYMFIASAIVAVLVLLGIMVGRGDANIENAVHHVFRNTDSEHVPLLPEHYYREPARPDVLVVAGDAWAANTGDTAWTAQLVARHLHGSTLVRLATANATSATVLAQLSALRTRVSSAAGFSGHTVAVLVQVGWNDLLSMTANPQVLAQRAVAFAQAMVLNITDLGATSAAAYIVDYPDVSAGTGYTAVPCASPLDAVYNNASAVSAWLAALTMYSEALRVECIRQAVAFVPLRQVLSRLGASPVAAASRTAVDVQGRRLARLSAAAVLPFTAQCDALGPAGQIYQCDLVAAFIQRRSYWTVG